MRQMAVLLLLLFAFTLYTSAQKKHDNYISRVWVADNGNGTYKNPILHADYSDPDAIRVGDDFYLISSSFEDIPGLPILHSKDLVNWTIIGHALQRQLPYDRFAKPRHGEGVWAPAIRYHNGQFYIYYPDPDFGIYLVTAKDPAGPWSEPVRVEAGKGLIDPCPLWDDDGSVYLVHAYAGSRAGIKSILVIKKLNPTGDKTIEAGKLVYDGHDTDPTIEGPKFYKHGGYYYILAPAGGVSTGWQLALRSKNIYGPYERKVVMDQGSSSTNGPHQGAWVTTRTGEDWFLHFQDKGAYGRVVHLEPMTWTNNWPVIGIDKDGDGKGEPVTTFKKPNVGKSYPIQTPAESDEFNSHELGLQWQWPANPKPVWSFMNPSKGMLRLFSEKTDSAANLWFAANTLQQKFPAEEFMVTAKLKFTPNPKLENEQAGLAILGLDYAGLAVSSSKGTQTLVYLGCTDAEKGTAEKRTPIVKLDSGFLYLRVQVRTGGKCTFSYSLDNAHFTEAGDSFTAKPGRWIGAKFGIFCTRDTQTNDAGYTDLDWVHVEPVKP